MFNILQYILYPFIIGYDFITHLLFIMKHDLLRFYLLKSV